MTDRYGYDLTDGKKMPPLVITKDHVLTGTHRRTVHVEAGTFKLLGTLQGTLNIQGGVSATIFGTQQGCVSVDSGATAVVKGAIEGSTTVQHGATLIIESRAKLAGSLDNDGLVIVRGVFGGTQCGRGELRLEGTGYIKQPEVIDGIHYYKW